MEMQNINADASVATDKSEISVQVGRPKRILHFSDGILEEFSDSEDDGAPAKVEEPRSETVLSDLQWGPWLFHKATRAGTTILAGCDYVGESLAAFLGITTPKYECEIEEFKRIQAENEKIEKEKAEHASWMEKESLNGVDAITKDIGRTNEKF